ncbi:MAG TPA: prepilin-type N-terminal cleavage/methylation domain-containing protein [Opitutaceae bacterium]|nr:prepilin-type N-terminal cleavage/methylation domain-containing protein [Opitutaceae bacterium]
MRSLIKSHSIDAERPEFRRSHHGSRRFAFTLVELMIGVVLAGVLVMIATKTVVAAKQLTPGQEIEIDGEQLAVAPSPSVFAEAIRLHSAFLQRVQSAKAIYVFGGEHHGLPIGASRLGATPLAATALPVINDFSAGLELDSFGFYQKYATKLGPREKAQNPDDLSVVTIGAVEDKMVVTGLLQVRGKSVETNDGMLTTGFRRRTATFYDQSGENWSYSFLEKPVSASVEFVGARHFWVRYFEGKVAEEAPCTVVCPDPLLYAGTRALAAKDEVPPFSRFSYVLEVSR